MIGGKLVLHPLCVLAIVLLFPPADPALRAAAGLFASMPMLSVYSVPARRYGHERFGAAALLLAATVASFVSISMLIVLLPAEWLVSWTPVGLRRCPRSTPGSVRSFTGSHCA